MRTVLAVAAAALLLQSCSSGDSADEQDRAGSASENPETTPAAPSEPADSSEPDDAATVSDACELLTTAEVERLLGASVGAATPGQAAAIPNCQWATEDGRFVQAISVDASEWARALPDVLKTVEASGQFSDPANLRKLRKAADLIKAGETLDPSKACAMFSTMVEEMQDQPPGTTLLVTVIPTPSDPQGLAGQACVEGVFTSVMVADPGGLEGKLPVDQVEQATKLAHRRAVG